MKKQLMLFICLVLLLTVASPLHAAPPLQTDTAKILLRQAHERFDNEHTKPAHRFFSSTDERNQTNFATLRLTNKSEYTICSVFISSTESGDWGTNRLEDGEVIAPGQIRAFELLSGYFNIRLLDCDENILFEIHGLLVEDLYKMSWDGLDKCQPFYEEGEKLYSQSLFTESLEQFQKSLTCYQENDDQFGQLRSLNGLGVVYRNLQLYDEALESYNQALAINQNISETSREFEANILENIGNLHRIQRHYDESLKHYKDALDIRRELVNRVKEGDLLFIIGEINFAQANFGSALNNYQQALAIWHDLEDDLAAAQCLNRIGGVFLEQARYDEARTIFEDALAIYQRLDNILGQGIMFNNIGLTYRYQQIYSEALTNFQQALEIYQDEENESEQLKTLHNIGLVYFDQERFDLALENYQQALTIQREISNDISSIEGTILSEIGSAYARLKDYDEALNYYQEALDIQGKVHDRAGQMVTLNNLGLMYQSQGQYGKALEVYQQAIEVAENIRVDAGSEMGRSSFVAEYVSLYNRTVSLLHRQLQDEAAFLITEQARARSFLDSLVTGDVQLSDNTYSDLLAQEQRVYTERQLVRDNLTKALASDSPNSKEVSDLEQQLMEAEMAYESIREAIEAHSIQLAALIPGRSTEYILDVVDVQAQLDEQTTLISYWMMDEKILAFILTGDSFETVALDVDSAEVTQEINNFRDFADDTAAHPVSAVNLYEILVEPLKDHFTTSHLAIIPHQSLHYLPFAALTDGDRYLIDDYTLTVLPSASALPFILENAKVTDFSGQPSALILGNPTTGKLDEITSLVIDPDQYSGKLPLLIESEKEAKAIAELFGTEALVDEIATESVVRERVSEANILHLAAHGKFNPVAPLNSFIALAPDKLIDNSQLTEDNSQFHDGWLTVGETYSLDLENTDLVVLSACDTNLGDLSAGDELVGLTRALIFAGTPSVIASLWAVEDEATSLLMEQFYTHLLAGMGKAAALRQAQIDVRDYKDRSGNYPYRNPYYWSGFVLSGDGGR